MNEFFLFFKMNTLIQFLVSCMYCTLAIVIVLWFADIFISILPGQGSYRPWKVLECYFSEFQALERTGKRPESWKVT